jgi:hypothetical protein
LKNKRQLGRRRGVVLAEPSTITVDGPTTLPKPTVGTLDDRQL